MSKQITTRRQKDISRLLRERKQAYPDKLRVKKSGRVGSKRDGMA